MKHEIEENIEFHMTQWVACRMYGSRLIKIHNILYMPYATDCKYSRIVDQIIIQRKTINRKKSKREKNDLSAQRTTHKIPKHLTNHNALTENLCRLHLNSKRNLEIK